MNNIKQSCVYGIEKNKNLKLIIIPIIVAIILVIALIIIFFANKTTPKSIVSSFLNYLQDYNTNKVVSYIDFESMVMLANTSNDINNLESNLKSLSNQSEDEQGNFKESVSYTKRRFTSIVEGLKNDAILFSIDDIKTNQITSTIYEVVAELTLKNDNTSTSDVMIFYVQKQQNKYRIISISDKFYF